MDLVVSAFAQGLKMGLSIDRAAEIAQTASALKGSLREQRDELFRLFARMTHSGLIHCLELRIVGDTPLLVERMSEQKLAMLAGEIPWPRWDEEVARQHEAATAAAGMIASHRVRRHGAT